MWLSLGVVILWLGRALLGGLPGQGGLRGIHGVSLSSGNLFLLALGLVLGGLLLWHGLSAYFWRKYFPTQTPPSPPGEGKAPSEDSE